MNLIFLPFPSSVYSGTNSKAPESWRSSLNVDRKHSKRSPPILVWRVERGAPITQSTGEMSCTFSLSLESSPESEIWWRQWWHQWPGRHLKFWGRRVLLPLLLSLSPPTVCPWWQTQGWEMYSTLGRQRHCLAKGQKGASGKNVEVVEGRKLDRGILWSCGWAPEPNLQVAHVWIWF